MSSTNAVDAPAHLPTAKLGLSQEHEHAARAANWSLAWRRLFKGPRSSHTQVVPCRRPAKRPTEHSSSVNRPADPTSATAGCSLGHPVKRAPVWANAPQCSRQRHTRPREPATLWPNGRFLHAPTPFSSCSPQRPPCGEAEAASAAGSPWLGVRQPLEAAPGCRRRTLAAGSGVGGPDPVRRGGSPRQADPAPAQL